MSKVIGIVIVAALIVFLAFQVKGIILDLHARKELKKQKEQQKSEVQEVATEDNNKDIVK